MGSHHLLKALKTTALIAGLTYVGWLVILAVRFLLVWVLVLGYIGELMDWLRRPRDR